MKRIKILLTILISLLLINNVYAATASLSLSSDEVYEKESVIVTVSVNSAAAWNIHLSSVGPVSDCAINQTGKTLNNTNTDKTFIIVCKTTGSGMVTLNLTGDATSAFDDDPVEISESRIIKVLPKEDNPVNKVKSKNNKIQSITVEGYDLTKINDQLYTLTVGDGVREIKVKVTPEDSKASVFGADIQRVDPGENEFEIIVTAENGDPNTIILKVTRTDRSSFEDLKDLLKENKEEITIKLTGDSFLDENQLLAIKDSKKIIYLNYYNDEQKLLYSWTINGAKINEIIPFNTLVDFISDNQEAIDSAAKGAEGLVYNVKHNGALPEGLKIKLYVGDKYRNNDSVNVYHYDNSANKLVLVQKDVAVFAGYIEFPIQEGSEYFITNTLIEEPVTGTEQTGISQKMIYIIIGAIAILVIIIVTIINKKKKQKKVNEDGVIATLDSQVTNNQQPTSEQTPNNNQ